MAAPGTPAAADWRVTLKRRLAVVAGLTAFWVVGIEVRLVFLQIVERPYLLARASVSRKQTKLSPAKRGDILDRRGRVLATSVDADTIYAVPTEIADPQHAAATLCTALRDCDAKDRAALADRPGAAQGVRLIAGRSRRIRRNASRRSISTASGS